MKCYHPVTVWKPLDGGMIAFREVKDSREIQIRCGQCIGCRLQRREFWTIRCYLESKMHSRSSFITLTYAEDKLPKYGSLNYRDFQLFMKRLRERLNVKVRFFMCGEYGDSFDRPHYHCLLFGVHFDDRVQSNSIFSKDPVFTSPTLSSVWTHGFHSIGEVSYESARYCAAYAVKKVTGDRADSHYMRVDPSSGECVWLEPEFARMSLRPGIGLPWLEKYWRDLYKTGHNAVIVNGVKKPIPRYFDSKMDEIVPLLMDEVEYSRYLLSLEHSADNTADRLAVQEAVTLAKIAFDKQRKESKPCNIRLLP